MRNSWFLLEKIICREGDNVARPLKDGVDYFPLDTVLDTKFELIEAEYGLTGFAVVVKLLQKIYREHGYYCEWTDEVALLFSKQVNEGCNVVSEIVGASVRRGIFDKDLFDKYHILTSNGIQKRYFEAVNRRTQINVIDEYLLVSDTQIGENVNKTQVIAYKNPKNVCNNSQSKGNKIKGNKSKEKDGMPGAAFADTEPEQLPVVSLMLNDKSFCHISQSKIDHWSELYPAVDIKQELLKMQGWLESNPAKRKTKNGIERFITGWLAKEQDKGRMKPSAQDKPKSRYDYEEFERKCFLNLHKDKFTESEGRKVED